MYEFPIGIYIARLHLPNNNNVSLLSSTAIVQRVAVCPQYTLSTLPFYSIMSDDDDESSIDTLPGEPLTEERLAELQKIHEERTDGLYLTGRVTWRYSNQKEPKKRRTRHMLVGLANPFPDHGLKRSPTGRVRSWRLEAQRKKEAALNPPSKRRKGRKRKGQGRKRPKKGQSKKKPGPQHRKGRAAK